jgi:hypothetical protein
MGAEDLALLEPLRRQGGEASNVQTGHRPPPRVAGKPARLSWRPFVHCFLTWLLYQQLMAARDAGLEKMYLICLLLQQGPERLDGEDNATYPSYRFRAARPHSGRA